MTFQTETLDTFLDLEPLHEPRADQGFRVVHPLYDAPETKRSADGLGPIQLTPACRIALIAVRGYLAAILLMGAWRAAAFLLRR